MAVGVIAYYRAMVQPQNSLQSESPAKFLLDFLFGKIFIPVHGAETFRCGEHGAASVTVDAAALEDIRSHVNTHHIPGKSSCIKYVPRNAVVKVGGEFQSPSVEYEIIQIFLTLISPYTDSSMVTGPCII